MEGKSQFIFTSLNVKSIFKFKIYLIGNLADYSHYKYILPDDLARFKAGWRSTEFKGICENSVLKKVIKEAIEGGNNP